MKIRDSLLAGPLGFGAAPLGNMFRNIPDEEAMATVDAAWRAGTSTGSGAATVVPAAGTGSPSTTSASSWSSGTWLTSPTA